MLVATRAQHPDGWRLPAAQLEPALSRLLQTHLLDDCTAQQITPNASAAEIQILQGKMRALAEHIDADRKMAVWPQLIERCDLTAETIKLHLDPDAVGSALNITESTCSEEAMALTAALTFRKRGFETKIVLGAKSGTIDQTLIQNIALGLTWYEDITSGATIKEITERTNVDKTRTRQIIEFALLSPDAIEDIIAGHQPTGLATE